jgi:hypothetical protein
MSVLMLPGMVACTGAVVVASENSNPEAVLTLTLRTEAGEECLMRISEQAAKQIANWPAPGSEDTELGVLMELEVRHGETEVYP